MRFMQPQPNARITHFFNPYPRWSIVKMAQNEDDTFMEDVPGSQAGESEAGEEAELEKKLFLVRALSNSKRGS